MSIFVYNTFENIIEKTCVAGEALGGHRAVIIIDNKAYYADSSNLSHANLIKGVTKFSADINKSITILFYGELELGSWNWNSSKPIILGSNGALTQVCPASGVASEIATVITQTRIFVNNRINQVLK